jgi:hypothetical protein
MQLLERSVVAVADPTRLPADRGLTVARHVSIVAVENFFSRESC